MEKSLQQIINAFETFSNTYLGIEQFATQIPSQNIAKAWKYPLMFITVGTSVIEPGQVRINMDVYFIDMGDETEYIKQLSKCLKLCEDFMTYFNKNEQTFGFYLSDTFNPEPIVMAFDDRVIGWKMPITVQTKSSENENLLPLV